jgi:hypothetical protein
MKFHKLLLILTAVLLLSSFLLSACGGTSAEQPKFPTGKFVTPDSKFTGYLFNEDKTWTFLYQGSIGAEGKYSVKGNLWTEEGTEECPFPATYEWSFDGTKLSFKLVGEDKCDPRRVNTDGRTFILDQ